MRTTPTPSIQRHTWDAGKPNAVPGVMVSRLDRKIYIPVDMLAQYSTFMLDALRDYEQQESSK